MDTLIECSIAPDDGKTLGEPATDSVFIQNRAPQVENIQILPEDGPYTDSFLTCVADISEPDNAELTVDITWTSFGNVLEKGTVLQLDPEQIQTGDEITCTIVAADPEGLSTTKNTTRIVENKPPALITQSIDTAPARSDSTLTCSAQGEEGGSSLCALAC